MDEKRKSNCTQTGPAFKVEIRATGRPVQLGDQIIGNEWTTLPTVRSFPLGTAHQDAADALTYTYNFYGAVALASSVMSQSRLDDLEARIVEFSRTITYELTREEELPLPGLVDRMFADAERGAERRKAPSPSEDAAT